MLWRRGRILREAFLHVSCSNDLTDYHPPELWQGDDSKQQMASNKAARQKAAKVVKRTQPKRRRMDGPTTCCSSRLDSQHPGSQTALARVPSGICSTGAEMSVPSEGGLSSLSSTQADGIRWKGQRESGKTGRQALGTGRVDLLAWVEAWHQVAEPRALCTRENDPLDSGDGMGSGRRLDDIHGILSPNVNVSDLRRRPAADPPGEVVTASFAQFRSQQKTMAARRDGGPNSPKPATTESQ